MSGVMSLIGTHLDISWEDVPIPVCTHYTDKKGKVVSYQPGLRYLADVVPHYRQFPGWDGRIVRKAKTYASLPTNAKNFLAFIHKRIGIPIIAVTTGPEREQYIEITKDL
jgi:adenylosuccinate synthase